MSINSILNNFRDFHVVVAGLGGTGSNLVPHLSQLAYSLKGKSNVSITLADGDTVEPDNIGRQFFIEREIGQKKAAVLQRRYHNAWSVDISYYDQYIKEAKILHRLLQVNCGHMPILVGCVDNNFSRQVFHQAFEESSSLIYLDAGNAAATSENTADNYAGQLVVGMKFGGKTILPPPAYYFPHILEEDDEIEIGGTCARHQNKNPQMMLANFWAAANLLAVLNNIVGVKDLPQYMTTFNGYTTVNRPERTKTPEEVKIS